MHPKDLSIQDFSYDLPDERIARYPVAERDLSKLLIYKDANITTDVYRSLPDILPADTLLIFNNTKVVEARLYFHKPTGGAIEIFCLEPDDRYADVTSAMMQKQQVYWKCLIGGAKKWKEGPLSLSFTWNDQAVKVSAEKIGMVQDAFIILFHWDEADLSFADILHHAGNLPLPPYMDRDAEDADKERYQTVYAKHDGSVAAPTAGLHFTESLLTELAKKNIHTEFVTLHVGAGTFKPVKAAVMQDHEMHAEYIDVSVESIQKIRQSLPYNIITVGTTSLRTVESLYWLGKKIIDHPTIDMNDLYVDQWDAYNNKEVLPSADMALQALENYLLEKKLHRLVTKTRIIIAPGYSFQIMKALITNFHQPQSTLLLLVAAITGDDWRTIYQYALDHDFRFLSYGDGSLLWNRN
ncbi:S-adenosylmethionine:tRNA ribosyltransferase-isomerase [Sediminibacterium sp. KACHI17]|uniref:S-adenosylmethionine:tRNA ribosyltransferase-isomerase n=1 Tax=Sediminibacterium sp. KACHI17 TaxID=1751071 RepID=A0AAT9GI23_9BACT